MQFASGSWWLPQDPLLLGELTVHRHEDMTELLQKKEVLGENVWTQKQSYQPECAAAAISFVKEAKSSPRGRL